jgi:hypothetical protein
MSDMYFKLLPYIKKAEPGKVRSQSCIAGVNWASSGGESEGLYSDRYLAADGMVNAIQVLDAIEDGKFPHLEFVELNACPGGCVGGAAAVENPYIAKARIHGMRHSLPSNQNYLRLLNQKPDYVPEYVMVDSPIINHVPEVRLSDNLAEAMRMMQRIDEIYKMLPQIDCGSCGAPTCRAFAEDVVKGECQIDDCVVYLRRMVQENPSGKGRPNDGP